jgi:hypothetical protein
MAADEDKSRHAGGQGQPPEPIKVPVDMPSRVDDATAVAMFLLDLQRSGAAWDQDSHAGYLTAMIAAVRFLHAVGSPGLSTPFRNVGEGFNDLSKGKMPPIFKPNPNVSDSSKTTAELNLSVDAACFLEVLVRGTEMDEKDAAQALASMLDKKKLRISRRAGSASTAVTIINFRRELSRPNSRAPDVAKDAYFYYTDGLLDGIGGIRPEARRKMLLSMFRQRLVEHAALLLENTPLLFQ